MSASTLSQAARTTPATQIVDTERLIDMQRLRAYRLGRVREQLEHAGCAACVLLDPISIRYATGFRSYALFQTHIPLSYLFLPVHGPVVLSAIDRIHHIARGLETIDEVRPGVPPTFYGAGPRLEDAVLRWTDELVELFTSRFRGEKRLAVGRTDPRLPLHLRERGIEVVDAQELVERARLVKSPDEILCMNVSVAVAECAMARMRAALEPGMSEQALWSILHQTNAAMGGEWIETRLLAAGDRTNPWQREVSARVIRPGELVAFDTDMVGPFGYCADISRTFHCGPGEPTRAQRTLYGLAFEEVHHNIELIAPGVSFRELSQRLWRAPERYRAHRYDVAMHGIGMCDEYPNIFYPSDFAAQGYDGVLEPGMTLCVESFVGAEDGGEGVKLEEMVLVTETGREVLSRFPFEEPLLA